MEDYAYSVFDETEEQDEHSARDRYDLIESEINMLTELLAHRGWQLLKNVMARQAESRRIAIGRAATGLDDVIVKEGLRGELNGIRLAIGMPMKMLQDLEEQHTLTREQMTVEEQEEQENGG